jgi:TolB-like protein
LLIERGFDIPSQAIERKTVDGRCSPLLSSGKGILMRGSDSSRPLKFGIFEADLRAGELYRSSVKVKLQQQPFQVLASLLERPGQVVNRHELRKRVWAADTFVDFERALNKAINRIREALDDSAENPRFIETVPRLGYRFIAPVQRKTVSLAVLPLENLSGDPKQEYWADGLTDELITHVAKIGGLRVISRTSAARFKRSAIALTEIARELAVDTLVQGSVVVSDRRVRISVQLIDPFSDQHLWAESFERELSDIVTLQAQIAQAVAHHIQARLTPEEDLRAKARKRVNPESYEAYLKGLFFLANRNDIEKGSEYFNKSIALDPQYAAPYAGLAGCWCMLGVLNLLPPGEVFPKARVFAEKALELDETLAEAHHALSVVQCLYDWEWRGAERELKKALQLDPNLPAAYQGYSVLLTCLQRHDEAIKQVLKGRERDPFSVGRKAFVAFIYMQARQFDHAIEECSEAIELDPNDPFGHWILARALDAAGQVREALAESELAAKLSGNQMTYAAHLAYALARSGDRTGACHVLHQFSERMRTEYISPYHFALTYTALGETDLAFEWLDKAYEERTPRLAAELSGRVFDGIRADPRFDKLVSRFEFPDHR